MVCGLDWGWGLSHADSQRQGSGWAGCQAPRGDRVPSRDLTENPAQRAPPRGADCCGSPGQGHGAAPAGWRTAGGRPQQSWPGRGGALSPGPLRAQHLAVMTPSPKIPCQALQSACSRLRFQAQRTLDALTGLSASLVILQQRRPHRLSSGRCAPQASWGQASATKPLGLPSRSPIKGPAPPAGTQAPLRPHSCTEARASGPTPCRGPESGGGVAVA